MRSSGLASRVLKQRRAPASLEPGSHAVDAGDSKRARDLLSYARSYGYIAYIREDAPQVVELVDPVGERPSHVAMLLSGWRDLRPKSL
jgi:hypothetical protein